MVGTNLDCVSTFRCQAGKVKRLGSDGNQVGHIVIEAEAPFVGVAVLGPIQDGVVGMDFSGGKVGRFLVEGCRGDNDGFAPIAVMLSSFSGTHLDRICCLCRQTSQSIWVGGGGYEVRLVIVETNPPIVNGAVLVPA